MVSTNPLPCFVIDLDRPESLLIAPGFDPFNSQMHNKTGFERLLQLLRAADIKPRSEIAVTLQIPSKHVSAGLKLQMNSALDAYCNRLLVDLKIQIEGNHKAGFRALRWGLLILVLCLIVSGIAEEFLIGYPLIQRVISESFIIAGWVTMWRPIELLLFVGKGLKRDQSLISFIKDIDLEIEPISESRAATSDL